MANSNIKRLMIPAGLVVGGVTVGSLLAPVGLASAQSDDDSTTDDTTTEAESTETESTETEADGGRGEFGGRHGHRHGKAGFGQSNEAIAEALGLTEEEVREGLMAGSSLADLAAAQSVEVEDLIDAIVAARTEAIAAAVEEGTIDEEKAAELTENLEERVTEMVNRTRTEGEGGRSGGKMRGGKMGGGLGEAAQEVLGLTSEEIREALSDGSTLADLAEAQGVDEADLVDAMVAEATERLDAAIADGRLDEEKAAEMADSIEEKVTDFVENGRPERAEMEGMERGGRGRGHRGGQFGGDDATTPEAEGEVVESSFNA